jgi:Trypsin
VKRAFLIALAVAVLAPASALAVWGGTVDTAHPSVGAMYFDVLGNGTAISDGLVCSGSYAGRSKDGRNDVFLTAGHCMPPPELGITAGQLLVSFDGDGTNGVSNPIKVSSFHQMPGFGHDFGDLHDLGVLLLPAGSVPAGTPAVQLPPAGYLDRLKASGQLKFTIVDIVGYGVIPIWEPAGPTQFVFDGVRRAGTTIITGLRASNVIYNQNRHGIGTGSGLCFGDSGSPQLAKGTLLVLSVTSGGNGQCNANNQNYRVDTPQARDFLGRFLRLP